VREAQGQVGYMNNGWTKSTNTNPSSRLANTLATHSPPPKKKKKKNRHKNYYTSHDNYNTNAIKIYQSHPKYMTVKINNT
jgi:hypothetical protein